MALDAARRHDVELSSIVQHALTSIGSELSIPATQVFIDANAAKTISETGLGGFTDPQSGHVFIWIDPARRGDRRSDPFAWLPSLLAHELHHSKRIIEGPGYGKTLLEMLVTEGLADVFVREVFPGEPTFPWDSALAPDQSERLWQIARQELSRPANSARWLNGHEDVPRFAGYTLGYHLVLGYLGVEPGATAASAVAVKAEAVLRASTFGRS
jgi:uncharacterized protein YjaZ